MATFASKATGRAISLLFHFGDAIFLTLFNFNYALKRFQNLREETQEIDF